jgi:hypothetical protein
VLARRLLIALAVLMALTALAASVSPRPEDARQDAAAAPGATATPQPPVEATLSADPEAGERLIEAERGQTVRLTIRGDELATVAIGELEVEVVDPESPALFELLADVPGDYPITLLESERRIGLLRIAG